MLLWILLAVLVVLVVLTLVPGAGGGLGFRRTTHRGTPGDGLGPRSNLLTIVLVAVAVIVLLALLF